MLFLRVKPEFDQKPIYRIVSGQRVNTGDIHIANELVTLSEAKRRMVNIAYTEQVEVKKNQTYWFFGARFAAR